MATAEASMTSKPDRQDTASPRVAVIGAGYWGKNLVRNFAELGALAAVVDADAAQAQSLAVQYGCAVAAGEAVLADPAIAAVAIAAPAALHFTLASAALEAGKHVYVEKPLALTVADGQALIVLAERHRRVLMVGHLLRYHAAFLALHELVREGRLGVLRYLRSSRMNFGKLRREEDVLWSFAPHDISMVLALVGEEPKTVASSAVYCLGNGNADVCTVDLGFSGALRAQVAASWINPTKEQKLVVVGSEAMAVFDDLAPWERKIMLYPHKVTWNGDTPVAKPAEGAPVPLTQSEPLRAECQHFIDCIASGETPRTDGSEGLAVLSVLARASDVMRAS
jgi:predicted dehydrogenase